MWFSFCCLDELTIQNHIAWLSPKFMLSYFMHHYILRLDISMNDFRSMQLIYSTADLFHQGGSFHFSHWFTSFELLIELAT